MAESAEDPSTDTAPLKGEMASDTKATTAPAAEESAADGSTSEMSPSRSAEPSLEESKKDDEMDAKNTNKEQESTTEESAADNAVSNHPEGSLDDDKNQNGDGKPNESAAEKEAHSENGGDSSKKTENKSLAAGPVVSSTKRTRPPYKYDPEKVVLRFLFANKDGLTVTVECKPGDTVGEVKGQLLSVWPDDLPDCSGGDQIRLICMGKGMLMPDTRTLEDCQVPIFKTHPTPVNVSVRPKTSDIEITKSGKADINRGSSTPGTSSGRTSEESSQGCGCVIQ